MTATLRLLRNHRAPSFAAAAVGLLILALAPFQLSSFNLFVASLTLVYAVGALGFGLLVGESGQVSLAHPVFFAIGAYATALASQHHFNIWVALLAGVGLSMAIALVSGLVALRLAEFYFSLVTLGLVLAFANYLSTASYTGSTSGLLSPPMRLFGTGRGVLTDQYVAIAVLAVAASCVSWGLGRSYLGRAFNAVRDMQGSAASLGVPVLRMKLLAFMLSAVYGCVGGAFYGGLVLAITPSQFGFNLLLLFLAILIVGGRLSIAGAFVGAVMFTFLPQKLAGFQANQNLIFGAAIMATMLFAPNGLVSLGSLAFSYAVRIRRYFTSGRTASETNAAAVAPATNGNGVAHVEDLALTQVVRPQTDEAPVVDADGDRPPRLVIRDLSKHFSGVAALQNVDLTLGAGEVIGLIGPNGSGKTTLLNCVSRMLSADTGQTTVDGEDITKLRADKIATLGIRRTFQHPHLVHYRTVLENVMLGLHLQARVNPLAVVGAGAFPSRREREARERAMTALEFFGLGHLASAPIGKVQGPVQKVIEVARCVVSEPRVLMLDEVASGVNSYEQEELASNLNRLNAETGVSMIVIEHDLEFVRKLASRLVVLNVGRVIADGAPQAVLESADVMESYLGV